MNIESQLLELTNKEKMLAMEILWKELSKNQSDVTSPDWHEEVLEVREGNERYLDLDEAKKKIQDSI